MLRLVEPRDDDADQPPRLIVEAEAQPIGRPAETEREPRAAGGSLLPDQPLEASLSGRANAGLLDLLFWRCFEVLKDFSEKKERRRPQTYKDGQPLGLRLRIPVGNRRRSSPEREAARDRGSTHAVQERARQPHTL